MSTDNSNNLELVKQNCIFCKISKGEIDSYKIFEDDKCLIILDINPVSKGHMLLVPKEHYMIFPLVPDEELNHFSYIIKNHIDGLKEVLGAKDIEIIISNGPAAGQMSNHFVIQLIPKYDIENIDIKFSSDYNEEELNNIFKNIVLNFNK